MKKLASLLIILCMSIFTVGAFTGCPADDTGTDSTTDDDGTDSADADGTDSADADADADADS